MQTKSNTELYITKCLEEINSILLHSIICDPLPKVIKY